MIREEFYEDQLKRKGYVCPDNEFDNPDGDAVDCTTCEHFKKDCIVYGKKAMSRAGNWGRQNVNN